MLHYIYLSGEHRELPLLEFRAVMESEEVKHSVLAQLDQVVLIESDEHLYQTLRRTALVKYAGILLGVSEVSEGIQGVRRVLKDSDICAYGGYDHVNFRRVKRYGAHLSYENLINAVNELSSSLCRSERGKKLDVIVSEGCVVVGLRMYERDLSPYRGREPVVRPFYAPGAMAPSMARVFINLSRASVKRKHNVLDPFCGAGGFLLEACSIGLSYVGVEINHTLSEGAYRNLIHYDCIPNVVNGDACNIPVDKVDSIATDPPYGRMSKPAQKGLAELMKCFLEESYCVLKRGSYMTFAQRIDIPLDEMIEQVGFKLVERIPNWVHGSLTRDILVVMKE
ncbi:MAG: hypothetical protein QXP80_03850 [Zestosphaera sp.]